MPKGVYNRAKSARAKTTVSPQKRAAATRARNRANAAKPVEEAVPFTDSMTAFEFADQLQEQVNALKVAFARLENRPPPVVFERTEVGWEEAKSREATRPAAPSPNSPIEETLTRARNNLERLKKAFTSLDNSTYKLLGHAIESGGAGLDQNPPEMVGSLNQLLSIMNYMSVVLGKLEDLAALHGDQLS